MHEGVINWLSALLGVTVIAARQSGPRPALPYVMVNLTGFANVCDNESERDYTESGGVVTLTPLILSEWRFSVHAYGEDPSTLLRPIKSALKALQPIEPLYADLTVKESGSISEIGEWINTQWEPRAQMPLIVQGYTQDGLTADLIETYSFDIQPIQGA